MIEMGRKAFLQAIFVFFLCLSFVSAQSLVEAAKKEKERRAKLRKKAVKVVTNEDLEKMKKSPAVSAPENRALREEGAEPASSLPPPRKIEKARPRQDVDGQRQENARFLEEKYEKAKEKSELLSIRLNGLWQKYHNLNDGTPKERVQSEISRTFLMLQKAQIETENAKKELDAHNRKNRKYGKDSSS